MTFSFHKPATFSVGAAAALLFLSAIGAAVSMQVTPENPVSSSNTSTTSVYLPVVENVEVTESSTPLPTLLLPENTPSPLTTVRVTTSTPSPTPLPASPLPTQAVIEITVDGEDKNPNNASSGTTQAGDTTVTWNNTSTQNQNTSSVSTQSGDSTSVSVFSQNSAFSNTHDSSFSNTTHFNFSTGGQ